MENRDVEIEGNGWKKREVRKEERVTKSERKEKDRDGI